MRVTLDMLKQYAEHMTEVMRANNIIAWDTYVKVYRYNDVIDYRLFNENNSGMVIFLTAGRDGTNKELWIQAQNFMAGVYAVLDVKRGHQIDLTFRNN